MAESADSSAVALWRDATRETAASYRRMIDASVEQLSDDEFFQRPSPEVNSVAVILRHLGGNLSSRWTDFLTTDGEKPTRDRETEFADWAGDRASLLAHFDAGWQCLTTAIEQITPDNLDRSVMIRGEPHTLPQAFGRSLAHIAYHAGQIAIIARSVHAGEWRWLTVAPGKSEEHNQTTWGTAAARSVFAEDDNESPNTPKGDQG